MQNVLTLRKVSLFGAALAVAMVMSGQAEARPQYLKAFAAKYQNLLSQAKKQKCAVCHCGKTKKMRNDYGKALMKHVGKKNQKDKAIINAALGKAEKDKKPATKKTFGDLIKAGKLPGTCPKKK